MQTFDELLAEANQHYALAHHHLGKVKIVLDLMIEARPASMVATVNSPVRCVREWVDWIGVNGPSLKGDIHEGTSVKFTERGAKYTVEWARSLATARDDQFAPNTLMKISGQSKGRGAPPKIYFLWSQRWDVYPKFGVGPIKPADWDVPTAPVEPVDNFEDWSMEELEPDEVSDETESPRFATVEEWYDAHAPMFDTIFASGTKLTVEEKQDLLDTLPDGTVDGNSHIALAYSAAVKRSREPKPLLGVIHPEPDPEPEQEFDPNQWAWIGHHNHLPHAWSEFCAISKCQKLDGPPPAT